MIHNEHQPFSTVGEHGYLCLLDHILRKGYESNKERTGTGTLVSPTPHQLHFPNVGENFPLLTTKYVSFNMLICEMLWFISGSTNTKDLAEIGSPAMKKQWDKWADENGELGPVYGRQWRRWYNWRHVNHTDQLQNAIDGIRKNPEGRRHIVSAWNPVDLEKMALPPCHLMFQFTCEPIDDYERMDMLSEYRSTFDSKARSGKEWNKLMDEEGVPKYKLHLHLLMRSIDMFLGFPFNLAEYSGLLLMVAKLVNMVPGGFTWSGVNCHIYSDHIEAVKTQLSRDTYDSPKVVVRDHIERESGKDFFVESIDDFTREHISLHEYNYHPAIKAEVSV